MGAMNYFFGFSYWKHGYIEPFFEKQPIFINPVFNRNHLEKALRNGLDSKSRIFIWGRKEFSELEDYAHKNSIPVFRIEDGFIRSVGLGSDLTQPYSLVVDSRGLYFDPTGESDLEHVLQNYRFREDELKRAAAIRHYMIDKKLSKYNLYQNIELDFPKEKKILLVPGQVEDDASIRYGAKGMNNLELLRQVRASRPDDYIVYKPHPDVLVGNRIGQVEEADLLRYCDKVVCEVGIDSVLTHADEVHTMTSLVGFEALMRGIAVVTYGMPFYAGWGLTTDNAACERRTRKLSVDELVAGAYLLYPRYIHPETLRRCEIEEVLEAIDRMRQPFNRSVWIQWRNWISRKTQMMIRVMKGLG